MKKFVTLFFFSLFISYNATAQEEISIVVKDTVKNTINPLAPAKAAFYSAILPGLGQA